MEYKVKFAYEEDDSFVELWQIIGTKNYVARYTCGPKHWCHVSDPLGYRELDSAFADDDVFIVCSSEEVELFRTCNGDGTADFNTPKQEAFTQWANFRKTQAIKVKAENSSVNLMVHWLTGTPAGNLNQWLLSFQDPDLYPKANDYPENWISRYSKEIGKPEVLHKYVFLGQTRLIERLHFRHSVCGVEWDKYYSGDYYIGATFDENLIGTMYSESQAKSIVTAAIKTHFPDYTSAVSYVDMINGWPEGNKYPVQRNVKIGFACEKILKGDYHREFVDRLAAEERAQSHFYLDGFRGIDEIRKKYPDCIEDHSIIV